MREKNKVRNLCIKIFNEEFYFMHTDDVIIVALKDNRKNEYSEDSVKNLHDSYLLECENKSLNNYLIRCVSY